MTATSTPILRHEPGTALIFPRDEGWHSVLGNGVANPDLRNMEWLYTNAHLVDEDGNRIVVFVAYFTQGLRLATVRRFDRDHVPLDEHQGTAVGLLRPSTARLDLSFRHLHGRDRWFTLDDGELRHASRLVATGPGFSVDLELRTARPPYAAGNVGHLPFADRGWFYYYSLTRLQVVGTVTVGERHPRPLAVSGQGWIDHQWGPFWVTPTRWPRRFEQYEWFSLQLSSGSDIVLTTVWTPDCQLPSRDSFGGAGLVRPDGTATHLVGAQRLTRTRFCRDPATGSVHACEWRFVAPEWDCDSAIRTRAQHQMTAFAPRLPTGRRWSPLQLLAPLVDRLAAFWEGSCEVSGRLEGVEVDGDGFAELIKRYPEPTVRLDPPIVRTEGHYLVVLLRWRSDPCDPAAPLTHRVRVYRSDGRLAAAADDLDVSVFCFDHRGADERYEVVVESHSCDRVLRGEARTRVAVGTAP